MRISSRLLLAALTFLAVAWLPSLVHLGPAGGSSDLGLADLLGRGSLIAFAVAFAGGVATSLTPCVYPLIPITVSIFGARKAGSRTQAMALSALYVLGIAIMYSALGVGAALTGKAFGSIMANGWVIGFVALVLAAMAASMFGAFELQLPSSLQARLNTVGGAGYAGALGMGLVSGIIAAPCTGPVLAAALTFVAAKGSVAFGLGIMFTYALGMGLLFFLIGAFSIALPKSGPWMDTVKTVFGVALLASALLFAKDVVPGARALFDASRTAVLVAAGAAALGVLVGALRGSFHAPGPQRLAKAVGVALLVGGVTFGLGAKPRPVEDGEVPPITWLSSYDEAIALARAEGKPVLIDFWAEWCVACKELDRLVWTDPEVRREAARFVAVKVDGTEGDDAFSRVAGDIYQIPGMPTVVMLDDRGRQVPELVVGLVTAGEMLAKLRSVDQACEARAGIPDAAPADARPGAVPVACAVRWQR